MDLTPFIPDRPENTQVSPDIPTYPNEVDCLSDLLEDEIVCQKRLDEECQFVILRGMHVWKGPYTSNEIERIRERVVLLKHYQTPHVILPSSIQVTKDGPFVIYPNLSFGYPIQFSWHREEFPDPVMSGRYRVYRCLKKDKRIRGSSLVSMSTALLRNRSRIYKLISEQIGSYFFALIQCYIFGIGDMYFTNMMIDLPKRYLYILDIDDPTEPTRIDEFFYLRDIPSSLMQKRWLRLVRPVYAEVLQRIRGLTFEKEEHIVRAEYAILLLTIYNTTALSLGTTEDTFSSSSSEEETP